MTAESARPCTECDEMVLGGFVWRDRYGHLNCLVPYMLAALMSETISTREAELAEELLDVFIRTRVAEARRRVRHIELVGDLRQIVGLPRARSGGES